MSLFGTDMKSTLSNEQKSIQAKFKPYLYSKVGQTAEQYNGQIIPDLLDLYGKSAGMVNGFDPGTFRPQSANAIGQVLKGSLPGAQESELALWQLMKNEPKSQAVEVLNDQNTARYFQQGVLNPMLQTFDQDIAPRIAQGFANVGAFSSRQGITQGNAASDLMSNATALLAQQQAANQSQRAGYADAQQNRSLQRQTNAVGAANQTAQSWLSQMLGGVNAANQYNMQPLQQAQGINQVLAPMQNQVNMQGQANYQDALRTMPENSPWLNQVMQFLGMNQSTPVQSQLPGAIGAIAGAGIGLMTGGFNPISSLLGGLSGSGVTSLGNAAGTGAGQWSTFG